MSLEESMNQSVDRLRAELMDRIEALELRVTSLETFVPGPAIPYEPVSEEEVAKVDPDPQRREFQNALVPLMPPLDSPVTPTAAVEPSKQVEKISKA